MHKHDHNLYICPMIASNSSVQQMSTRRFHQHQAMQCTVMHSMKKHASMQYNGPLGVMIVNAVTPLASQPIKSAAASSSSNPLHQQRTALLGESWPRVKASPLKLRCWSYRERGWRPKLLKRGLRPAWRWVWEAEPRAERAPPPSSPRLDPTALRPL